MSAGGPDPVRTFESLDEDQRAVVWAVVRSIATALWVSLVLMLVVLVFLASRDRGLALVALVPVAGVAALAVTLEIRSRDLERPGRPPR